jgi:hypothetical protein
MRRLTRIALVGKEEEPIVCVDRNFGSAIPEIIELFATAGTRFGSRLERTFGSRCGRGSIADGERPLASQAFKDLSLFGVSRHEWFQPWNVNDPGAFLTDLLDRTLLMMADRFDRGCGLRSDS